MPPIITFDAGQVLIELDLDFLSVRLAERGATTISAAALAEAAPAAWAHHDARVREGASHPWRDLMAKLVGGAGVAGDRVGEIVDWLWREQPRKNLFRKPILPMVALARELAASGARVGVLSNSEGALAELLAEIGVADPFAVIVDSGKLGIAKPDPRIFAHAEAALGGGAPRIHIGDSWAADVEGALGAGWSPIWYGAHALPRPGVEAARDAGETRAAIARILET